jgi:hypothetical protein
VTTQIEKDISLQEAARLVGHSPERLRRIWGEIPTAWRDGSRFWVNPVGLREWLHERGQSKERAA